MLKRYSRFAVEELLRRMNKNDAPLSKTKILNLLVPDHAAIINEFKDKVQARAEQDIADKNAGDDFAGFIERANQLRAQAEANNSENG